MAVKLFEKQILRITFTAQESLLAVTEIKYNITHTFPTSIFLHRKSAFTCGDQRVLAVMPVFNSNPVEISTWDTGLKFAFG